LGEGRDVGAGYVTSATAYYYYTSRLQGSFTRKVVKGESGSTLSVD
jgi:hypothetical protein